jgi:hypothetical protein
MTEPYKCILASSLRTTSVPNYLDQCRAVEYEIVDLCPSGVGCQTILSTGRHICEFDHPGIGGVGCQPILSAGRPECECYHPGTRGVGCWPILSAGRHICKFVHPGTGKCRLAADNCSTSGLAQFGGDSVLPFLLSVHNNTMSGQGGHGSRGRCVRYNMRCGRTGLPTGRQLVREEDNGAVDDLRES